MESAKMGAVTAVVIAMVHKGMFDKFDGTEAKSAEIAKAVAIVSAALGKE